jgi:hypothetical protein
LYRINGSRFSDRVRSRHVGGEPLDCRLHKCRSPASRPNVWHRFHLLDQDSAPSELPKSGYAGRAQSVIAHFR